MNPTQRASRRPADPPHPSRSEEPNGAVDIDLERATWDAEYRRRAIELLRRAREAGPRSQDPDGMDGQS